MSPSAQHLTFAEAARIMREATKDKSYQNLPLGNEAARYLRAKRKELTAHTHRNYESRLATFALHFADLELHSFELPQGAELMEDFMDERWGTAAPGTYNVVHSVFSDFFDWQVKRQRMRSNPMRLVTRAKRRDVYRTTFSDDQSRAILANASDRRDRIALRLLLFYGIRKGALQRVQFKHFDHQRKRLTIFTKGEKVRELPLPEPAFWMDLERLLLDVNAQPDHFLMYTHKQVPRAGMRIFLDRPKSETAMHQWWYARLSDAGVVPKGTTSGERMHKARHTAGQRVLDKTGNLKATQKLLGHASIQTTGDIYADWDIDQLTSTLAGMLSDDDPQTY